MKTLEEAMNHPLWNTQVALEAEMRSLGIERFNANVDKAKEKGKETRVRPVRRMMEQQHTKMVAAIQGFYETVEKGGRGPRATSYKFLKAIEDDDLVAHLTCRLILDVSHQKKTLAHVAARISEALEDECNYRLFREEHEAGYLKAAMRARQKGNDSYKRRSVLGAAKKLGVNLIDWGKNERINVGSKLVELFEEATGLIRVCHSLEKHWVEEVPEMRAWIEEECRKCAFLSPAYLPTMIPPRPWTGPFEGGYWTGRARRLTLVKTPNRPYLAELENREMPRVYQSINALQETAWAVNHKVLSVMEHLWDIRSTCGMIPYADDQPLPTKPGWLEAAPDLKEDDMTPEQREQFIEWKSEAVRVRDENAEAEEKRRNFARLLWVAAKFKDGEFFYPYQLDWRGRAYPVGLYLQPQGNDSQRGLLTFADLCPINDQGAADWLAIHGAGLWGIDKVSFEERVKWVEDHSRDLEASGQDPYANTFWQTAEKPWQALAFCFEWAEFKQQGFGYLSSLPVQMDGTCNGLQNFSAMLLDAIGGAEVNLIPDDKPHDIYMEVAKLVLERVQADLLSDAEVKNKGDKNEGIPVRELASMWLKVGVTRKLVKRPVMTLSYGATEYGFTEMVNADFVRPLKREAKKNPDAYPFGKHGWKAAQYMSRQIWEAASQIVVAAFQAMEWLKIVAEIVSKQGLPINWTTPTGLLVQQNYKVRNMKQIKLAFRKERITTIIDQGSDKLDTRKQASGISPNWVHSLDASHMMLTISAAHDRGIRSFSFIHDSYGTHAGNTQALAEILREQFVEMYQGCVLSRFREDLIAMLPEGIDLPCVPVKGDLNLNLVLQSQFFFA